MHCSYLRVAPGQSSRNVHQTTTIGGGDNLRARRLDGPDLRIEHRPGQRSEFDREHSAEAAALLDPRQRPELKPADSGQQAQRLRGNVQPPQPVAGGVIGDAVWKVSADVLA